MADFFNPRRLFAMALAGESFVLVWLAWLSRFFAFGSPEPPRPILLVVTLLSVAFLFQMLALWQGLKLDSSRSLMAIVVGVSVAFRLLFFFTPPIQEVDLYRYIWDGHVSMQGISPYRFSPNEIVDGEAEDQDLMRLRSLVDANEGLADVLDRVHYPSVTTVYPPISQCVFAMAAVVSPGHLDAAGHVRAMKAVLLLFDLMTLLLTIALLRVTGLHVVWAIVYGWSPLVLKEFANSGHLDSIAVCAMVAGLFVLVSNPRGAIVLSALLMAMGVGAKLFPVILFPICVAFVLSRFGWRSAFAWAAVAVICTAVCIAPQWIDRLDPPQRSVSQEAGLQTFLSQWEMNDLIFMVIEENLRPFDSQREKVKIWFAVTPDSFRQSLVSSVAQRYGIDPTLAPFLVTRLITTVLFAILVFAWAWRTYREPSEFLSMCFLTIAWFWFLSPTQNPWYWTWALPLVAFARNRAWLAVAAFTLVYYCRFWFDYHEPQVNFLGQTYQGVSIFDFLIVWLEFGCVLILLLAFRLGRRKHQVV